MGVVTLDCRDQRRDVDIVLFVMAGAHVVSVD